MIKLPRIMLLIATMLTYSNAYADLIAGLYLDANIYQLSASGSFGSEDTFASFSFDDEAQFSLSAAFEHPVPLIPNVKLRYNQLDVAGTTTLSSELDFAGQTFSTGQSIDTDTDFSHVDIILYYEIFDTHVLSADVGVNFKYLDGTIDVANLTANGNNARQDISAPIPMAYLKAHVGLPLTGLKAFVEGNFIGLGDDRLTDYQLGLQYKFIDNLAVDAALNLGYRAINLDVDDLDNITADLDFDGLFAGIQIHF